MMSDSFNFDTPVVERAHLDKFSAVLERHQEQMRFMLAPTPTPEAGQIWSTTCSFGRSSWEDSVAAVVLLLRVFTRELTGERVADVAPITEDARLAADWSIVFAGRDSGIATPIVAHLDMQFAMPVSNLQRCLGVLPSAAQLDLTTVLRAFDEGVLVTTPLEVAILGRADVRLRREWLELGEHLSSIVEDLGLKLDDHDEDVDEVTVINLPGRERWMDFTANGPPAFNLDAGASCDILAEGFDPASCEIGSMLQWVSIQISTDLGTWAQTLGFTVEKQTVARLLSSRLNIHGDWRSALTSEIGPVPPEGFRLVSHVVHFFEDHNRQSGGKLLGKAARRTDSGH